MNVIHNWSSVWTFSWLESKAKLDQHSSWSCTIEVMTAAPGRCLSLTILWSFLSIVTVKLRSLNPWWNIKQVAFQLKHVLFWNSTVLDIRSTHCSSNGAWSTSTSRGRPNMNYKRKYRTSWLVETSNLICKLAVIDWEFRGIPFLDRLVDSIIGVRKVIVTNFGKFGIKNQNKNVFNNYFYLKYGYEWR